MLTQKILYEFLASTKYWRKRCYISFWCQHNVDAKRCYIRFGVNKRLTLKDISCRKNVLFFTSTHRWRNDFKRHELLHHYGLHKKCFLQLFIFSVNLKVIFLVVCRHHFCSIFCKNFILLLWLYHQSTLTSYIGWSWV